ncbi:MAG: DUF3644 domain-containing protein [Acetobacteraceae bacterium]
MAVEAPKRAKRRRGSALEQWEVAIIKAMLAKLDRTDQDILAYFTRPSRSLNHRLIGQIRKGIVHTTTPTATDEDLVEFLATWPEIDHQTGLSIRGDELLIKAREAMIAAVHTFNRAGLHFRDELFIVTHHSMDLSAPRLRSPGADEVIEFSKAPPREGGGRYAGKPICIIHHLIIPISMQLAI